MDKRPRRFIDLHKLTEDERIKLIAGQVRRGGKVGFVVDSEPPDQAKAARYLAKLTELIPGLVLHYRGEGPTPHAYSIVVSL